MAGIKYGNVTDNHNKVRYFYFPSLYFLIHRYIHRRRRRYYLFHRCLWCRVGTVRYSHHHIGDEKNSTLQSITTRRCMYIYIYIYREREREKKRKRNDDGLRHLIIPCTAPWEDGLGTRRPSHLGRWSHSYNHRPVPRLHTP